MNNLFRTYDSQTYDSKSTDSQEQIYYNENNNLLENSTT